MVLLNGGGGGESCVLEIDNKNLAGDVYVGQ